MRTAAAAALIHFLWQGALIGVMAALGFAIARTPRARYFVGVAALALMAVAPLLTAGFVANVAEVLGPSSIVHGSQPSEVLGSASRSADPGQSTVNGREPWTLARGPWTLSSLPVVDPRIASLVLAIWMLGVGALSTRLAFGWFGARRLTRRVTAAGASVQTIANRLIAALNIRARVRVVESAFVKVPSVIGAFKPVVLLPAAAMSGLSMEQVEALLAHELAHVRRHDYLVNLLQSAVETLLFYHPAVWLVSHRVRQERELCCDDLALDVCSDRVAYASALADLESFRAMPAPVLAATGGSLLARIRRILGHDDVSALSGRSKSLAGIAILASMVLVAGGQVARARAVLPGSELDSRRAEWSTTPPQAAQMPQGIQSGVAGGVQGGVAGGVQGGVAGGVEGGVQGGVKTGIPQSDVDVRANMEIFAAEPMEVTPEPQTPPGPAIQVGQLIRLEVAVGVVRQMEFNKDYTVQPDGIIRLPYIGEVKAAGLTAAALQQAVGAALIASGTLPGARVVASIEGRSSSDSVWVLGEVKSPGAYAWREGLTVDQMISIAGGVSPMGSAARVHTQSSDAPITFSDAVTAGSTIMVPKKNVASVTVQGAVRSPGRIQLMEERLTISSAIAAAGGLQPSAGSRIYVRRAGLTEPIVIRKDDLLQGRAGEAATIRDGDTITVEVAPYFYVTGYVKNSQTEYKWEPGMTLPKAIALAGGVSEQGAANRIEIERKDPKTGEFTRLRITKDKMATAIEPNDVIKVPARRL